MDLTGKSLAVYGLGVTGLATLEYLKTQSLKDLLVLSRGEPKDWEIQSKDFSFPLTLKSESDESLREELSQKDLILLSPGIPKTVPVLAKAVDKVPIWNEVELAFRFFKKPILAVTGTNGKTTTVTFLGECLRALGLRPFIGGNIGIPFVDSLKEREAYDCAVLELSSFQCELLDEFHAPVNCILNLFANHGERYENTDEYRRAKWELVRKATPEDLLFIGNGVGESPFDFNGELTDLSSLKGSELSNLFDLSQLKVVGAHNRINLTFAYYMVKSFVEKKFPELNNSKLNDTFQSTLNAFSGVEHRVEGLGKRNGFWIFNDAKSTNWEATLTAIRAVREKELPIALVLGGQLRGNNDLPPKEFLEIIEKDECSVFTIGEAGKLLDGDYPFMFCDTLEMALKEIKSNFTKDCCLLFSPAFPSFDQFKNYADRGRVFKKLIDEKYSLGSS